MLAALAVANAAGGEPPQAAWQRLAAQGSAALDDHRPQAAFDAFSAAIIDKGFDAAPSQERHLLLRQAAYAGFQLKRWRETADFYRRAATLPEGNAKDLFGIYAAVSNTGDRRGSVMALTAVLRSDVTVIREEDEAGVWQTFARARELVAGDPARFELLDAAFTAHYRNNLGEVSGRAWIDLAGLLLARGDTEKAARVIDELDKPGDLVDVRADNRFASLVDTQPARYDVTAAVRKRVERMRALQARKPRSLEALIALATAHKDAGQPAVAVAMLEGALARVGVPGAFDDQEQFVNWLHDERSRVLWRLGRRDESLVELQKGMAVPEHGSANVNQLINLAQRYAVMNRPDLALNTLDRLDADLSPYGRMAAQLARLAAADELGDEAAIRTSLDFMRGHAPDAPHILREGLVLAGLLDEAAQVFIGELDDPMFRSAALHEVQKFDDVPLGLAPARWLSYSKQLLARADVKAAIARYGRIQTYALPPQ